MKIINHDTPQLLQALCDFDKSISGLYLDIEFIEDGDERLDHFVRDQKDEFHSFAQDGTSSIMALWNYEKNTNLDETPIAFLNSEGGGAVVASNILEFLSLLPYDTAFFSTAISHWTDFLEMPNDVIPPNETYTEAFYSDLKNTLEAINPNYLDFQSWLKTKMGIKVCENPYELIAQNLEKFPKVPYSYREDD